MPRPTDDDDTRPQAMTCGHGPDRLGPGYATRNGPGPGIKLDCRGSRSARARHAATGPQSHGGTGAARARSPADPCIFSISAFRWICIDIFGLICIKLSNTCFRAIREIFNAALYPKKCEVAGTLIWIVRMIRMKFHERAEDLLKCIDLIS